MKLLLAICFVLFHGIYGLKVRTAHKLSTKAQVSWDQLSCSGRICTEYKRTHAELETYGYDPDNKCRVIHGLRAVPESAPAPRCGAYPYHWIGKVGLNLQTEAKFQGQCHRWWDSIEHYVKLLDKGDDLLMRSANALDSARSMHGKMDELSSNVNRITTALGVLAKIPKIRNTCNNVKNALLPVKHSLGAIKNVLAALNSKIGHSVTNALRNFAGQHYNLGKEIMNTKKDYEKRAKDFSRLTPYCELGHSNGMNMLKVVADHAWIDASSNILDQNRHHWNTYERNLNALQAAIDTMSRFINTLEDVAQKIRDMVGKITGVLDYKIHIPSLGPLPSPGSFSIGDILNGVGALTGFLDFAFDLVYDIIDVVMAQFGLDKLFSVVLQPLKNLMSFGFDVGSLNIDAIEISLRPFIHGPSLPSNQIVPQMNFMKGYWGKFQSWFKCGDSKQDPVNDAACDTYWKCNDQWPPGMAPYQ